MASDMISGALDKRRARGMQAAAVMALLIVLLRLIPWTSSFFLFPLIEGFAYDTFFETRAPRDMSDYLIVAIDEESLLPEHLGRFPWDRSVYVDALEALSEARVVAFDVLFSEPSADDAAFSAAMQRHGRVLLAAHQRERLGRGQADMWQGYGHTAPPNIPTIPSTVEFIPPVPLLAQAAAGIGYVDIRPDSDGVYRRFTPLVQEQNGTLYPHLSVEIARVARNLPVESLVAGAADGRLDTWRADGRRIPLGHGDIVINYAGPVGTVPALPFWKVAAGDFDPADFRDKIVIIGATAAGLYDIRPAPYRASGRIFFGVETNISMVDTLLRARPITDASGSVMWALYAFLLGIFVTWAVWYSRETVAVAAVVVVFGILALPSFMAAAVWLHQFIPYGAIVLAVAVPATLALFERMGVESREIRHQFGTYVSPDVLRELTEHPDVVRSGARREVTLLFSDVRGSTALCENMPPEQWIEQLNEYLSEMSEAIFAYDGYLDKFMGDGIMAVWNAFGNQPDHAELAFKAALQMQHRLKHLNEKWAQYEDRVNFQIGIAIHSGTPIVGNVGSDRRTQYTAIGDAVNTASRLEAQTKVFHAPILISETTAELLAGRTALVELGSARLQGREQPIRVFKPDGWPGEVIGHVRQKAQE